MAGLLLHWRAGLQVSCPVLCCPAVGFHNFNLRIFNLRVSNPNKLIVDVFLTRCRISMCQGLGPNNHDEIREIDRVLSIISYLQTWDKRQIESNSWRISSEHINMEWRAFQMSGMEKHVVLLSPADCLTTVMIIMVCRQQTIVSDNIPASSFSQIRNTHLSPSHLLSLTLLCQACQLSPCAALNHCLGTSHMSLDCSINVVTINWSSLPFKLCSYRML